ncbi:hypothetical protein L1049_016063 [Liquidambar formosana]|uniref:Myb-like domain-containing protein n=1 Tax=Liquidambar formosana TaxID=63359 RepID=A0AAP0S4L3_LIQFO
MDEEIARWILEYLLRQATDDRFMNRLLSILPLPNGDPRTKKTMLLKTIEFEISNGSVSEKILEMTETIAELDKRVGIAVSQSMKDAYCAVAVDCTVRFMKKSCNQQGKYFDTVKRIWRERIPNVERSEMADLVSDQLKYWKDDIEAAVWDSKVCENILMMNTRNKALKAVTVYIAEAWKFMGPTFLEFVAQIMSKSASEEQGMRNDCVNNQVQNETSSLDTCHDLGINNKPSASLPKPARELGERCKDQFGERVMHEDLDGSVNPGTRDKDQEEEGATTLPNAGRDLSAGDESEMGNKGHSGKRVVSSPNAGQELGVRDGPTSRNKNLSGERVTMRDKDRVEETTATLPIVGQDSGGRSDPAIIDGIQVGDRALASLNAETQKENLPPKRRHAAGHGRPSRGGVKITDSEELSIETSNNKYGSLPTPEVNKVKEALRSSSLELQAVVKDPLPDALRLADTVLSDIARKNMNHESSVENQDRMDVNVPKPSVNESVEPFQANEGHLGNQCSVEESVEPVQANEGDPGNQCSRLENNVPRPSLMERNGTARSYEWDDSIDGSPEGSPRHSNRLHLPSPKRKAISPLKKFETKKFARRRKMKKWSVLEEDTLRTGVKRHGKGNWKVILNSYRDIFEERTEVSILYTHLQCLCLLC